MSKIIVENARKRGECNSRDISCGHTGDMKIRTTMLQNDTLSCFNHNCVSLTLAGCFAKQFSALEKVESATRRIELPNNRMSRN